MLDQTRLREDALGERDERQRGPTGHAKICKHKFRILQLRQEINA